LISKSVARGKGGGNRKNYQVLRPLDPFSSGGQGLPLAPWPAAEALTPDQHPLLKAFFNLPNFGINKHVNSDQQKLFALEPLLFVIVLVSLFLAGLSTALRSLRPKERYT